MITLLHDAFTKGLSAAISSELTVPSGCTVTFILADIPIKTSHPGGYFFISFRFLRFSAFLCFISKIYPHPPVLSFLRIYHKKRRRIIKFVDLRIDPAADAKIDRKLLYTQFS